MLSINIQECKDCGSILEAIELLDEKISQVSDNVLQMRTVLAPRLFSTRYIKTLIYYREILENLYWNTTYYGINYRIVISKVKSII